MSESPSLHRTRFATIAGLLGASAVAALVLGAGPTPSLLHLAGASDDAADDISGSCDEAEHAADPECAGTPTSDGSTTITVDDSTSTMLVGAVVPDSIRSLDAAGAGTVIYAVEGGGLRLVTATPAGGWAVEVEQGAGREVELDFRAGTQRVQVNVEIDDGQVRERVRFRDDADDTDLRIENGVVVRDEHADDDNSGPGSDDDVNVNDDDRNSGPGDGDDDSTDDDSKDDDSTEDDSGSGRDGPEDD